MEKQLSIMDNGVLLKQKCLSVISPLFGMLTLFSIQKIKQGSPKLYILNSNIFSALTLAQGMLRCVCVSVRLSTAPKSTKSRLPVNLIIMVGSDADTIIDYLHFMISI